MIVLDSFHLAKSVSPSFLVPVGPLDLACSYEPTSDDVAALYGPGVLGDTDWLGDEEKVIQFEGMTELQYGNEYLNPSQD